MPSLSILLPLWLFAAVSLLDCADCVQRQDAHEVRGERLFILQLPTLRASGRLKIAAYSTFRYGRFAFSGAQEKRPHYFPSKWFLRGVQGFSAIFASLPMTVKRTEFFPQISAYSIPSHWSPILPNVFLRARF
jgi:hypothetical protein